MGTLSIFRGLIFAALAFFAAELLMKVVGPSVPEEVGRYLDAENAGSLSDLLRHGALAAQLAVAMLILGYFAMYVGSLLGMLSFRRWARLLFVISVPVGFVIEASYSTSISTPLQSVVAALVAGTQGAILVLLCVEPIRTRFRETSAAAIPPPDPHNS